MSKQKNQQKNKAQQQQQQQTKKTQENKKNKKKASSSSCSCFWLVGSLVLLGAIGGALYYDTQTNGGGKFEKSQVGKLLKDTGALPYVETGTLTVLKYSCKSYKWAEHNVPIYYNTTATVLKPYVEVARDLGKIALNGGKNAWAVTVTYVDTKRPVVAKFIEQYAPGLPEMTSNFCCSTWTSLKTVTINSYTFAVEFFTTKVFIGNLSPESLHKIYNSTQNSLEFCRKRFLRNVEYYSNLK